MIKTDHSQRLLAKRHHRILGMYLAVGAWTNNLDAIILDRECFTRYLGLERVKQVRIQQFKNDVKEWFPYTHVYVSGNSLESLYLSRIPMLGEIPDGIMSTANRVKGARENLFAIEEWRNIHKDIETISEEEVVSFIALLSTGLAAPKRGDLAITFAERLTRMKIKLRQT